MSVTPEQFEAALRQHPRVADAATACGISKARVYQRADLAAVAKAHAAAERQPRNAAGQLGCHGLALPRRIVDRLDAYRAEMAQRVGPRRASRSAVARAIVKAALSGPLPKPDEADGMVLVLDFGDVWDMVGERVASQAHTCRVPCGQTVCAQVVAGVVRAILETSEELWPRLQVPEKTGQRKKVARGT